MARAADPILASAIWTSGHDAQADPINPGERPAKRRRLTSGHAPIDKALEGGIDAGSMSCLSCEPGSGADELAQAMMASHQLSLDSPDASAVYIDSTQTLDVRKLHRTIVSTLERRGESAHSAAKEALRTLERLKIMKVFDFVGLTEAIGEVRDLLEGRTPTAATRSIHDQSPEHEAPRGTIADSQDDGDEDEKLDKPNAPQRTPHQPPKQAQPPRPQEEQTASRHSPLLLIINNLPTLTTPLTKANFPRGTALLLTFIRSLSNLTRTHNIYTLILNPGTSHFTKDESPSIFQSCSLRPLLGKGFAAMVDLHLLVHLVPKGKEDARRAYGKDGEVGEAGRGGRRGMIERVGVVEVWKDRHAGRVGRWAAFRVDGMGVLRDID